MRYEHGEKVRHTSDTTVMVVDKCAGGFVTCLTLTPSGLVQKVLPAAELVPLERPRQEQSHATE